QNRIRRPSSYASHYSIRKKRENSRLISRKQRQRNPKKLASAKKSCAKTLRNRPIFSNRHLRCKGRFKRKLCTDEESMACHSNLRNGHAGTSSAPHPHRSDLFHY